MRYSRHHIFVILLMLLVALLPACDATQSATGRTPSDQVVGVPVDVQDLDIVSGQTIYVPAYSEVPYTGDASHALLYGIMAITSLAGFGATVAGKRRKKK